MGCVDLLGSVREADALILVPPFAGIDRPSLGVHILQACAGAAGMRVRVLYANLLLAAQIGERTYNAICYAPCSALLGERYFARAAYGRPPFGEAVPEDPGHFRRLASDADQRLSPEELGDLEARSVPWIREVAAAVADTGCAIVGATTTFEQTAASIALLGEVKRLRPDTLTLLGGANCEGEMGHGLQSLRAPIDFIFSGESEAAFPAFLAEALRGVLPVQPIVEGSPCMNLDEVPTPTFDEYYEQLATWLPDSDLVKNRTVWLPYETSRGCWWGQKKHCTFCGLNARGMTYRRKTPDRVVTELSALLARHPSRQVCMVDNIMPHEYFGSLVPRLARELPDTQIFYEQKANLTLANVVALVEAGIRVIQPGIEALSTALLQRMRKGVTARQNVALLRYARASDLFLNWNLLYAFPGDAAEDYEQTLALLALIRHLMPPGGLYHLSIDRFSPYFDQAEDFGLSRLRPLDSYVATLPDHANVEQIAYHFSASYASGILARPDLIRRLQEEVAAWIAAWQTADQAPPSLAVEQLGDDLFILFDSRKLDGTEQVQFLTRAQAELVLCGAKAAGNSDEEEVRWALDRRLIAELDGWHVPLATATPNLLGEFEDEARSRRRGCSTPDA